MSLNIFFSSTVFLISNRQSPPPSKSKKNFFWEYMEPCIYSPLLIFIAWCWLNAGDNLSWLWFWVRYFAMWPSFWWQRWWRGLRRDHWTAQSVFEVSEWTLLVLSARKVPWSVVLSWDWSHHQYHPAYMNCNNYHTHVPLHSCFFWHTKQVHLLSFLSVFNPESGRIVFLYSVGTNLPDCTMS
jgi:hypothetical protein